MSVTRGQDLHVVSLYRRYLGINSFFWTSGIYDVCATTQLLVNGTGMGHETSCLHRPSEGFEERFRILGEVAHRGNEAAVHDNAFLSSSAVLYKE